MTKFNIIFQYLSSILLLKPYEVLKKLRHNKKPKQPQTNTFVRHREKKMNYYKNGLRKKKKDQL